MAMLRKIGLKLSPCFAVLALMLLVGTPAMADPVQTFELGLSDCPTCFGSVYTLTIVGDPTGTDFTVTLTIDATNYDDPSSGHGYITAVDFKISSNVTSAILTSFDGNSSGTDFDSWHGNTFINTGINNSNCASSGSGFVCSEDALSAPADGIHTWSWDVTIPAGTFMLPGDYADTHIGAKYGLDDGVITSDSGTPVPEPASLALLGTGLIMLGGKLRKKLRK